MRKISSTAALAIALLFSAGAAAAAVQVHIAVRPDTIPQCGPFHLSAALVNTGDDTLLVRVNISLLYQDSIRVGLIGARTRLLPHELRAREADLVMPRIAVLGHYTLVLRASGSDGSVDVSRAGFEVVEGVCPPDANPITAATDLMNGVRQSMGLDPDSPTPTQRDTWGGLKVRYR